jgi:hypothetical protein
MSKKPVTVTMNAVRQLVRESLGIDMTSSVPIKPEEVVDPISVSTAPMSPMHPIENIEQLSWAIRDELTNVPLESAEAVYNAVLKTIEQTTSGGRVDPTVVEGFITSGMIKSVISEVREFRNK